MNTAIAIAVNYGVIMEDQKFMCSGSKDVVLSKDWVRYRIGWLNVG